MEPHRLTGTMNSTWVNVSGSSAAQCEDVFGIHAVIYNLSAAAQWPTHKRFLTVPAARCGDKQAAVTSHDGGGGGYEGTSQHRGRQRQHKELWIITAAVNRLH